MKSAYAESSATVEPAVRCAAIEATDLSQLPDAPTEFIRTTSVDVSSGVPAYCQVVAYVAPGIEVMVRLPSNWNGKFMEVGCGAFCGSTDYISDCDDPLRRGYACVTSDMGHRSKGSQALWAYDNLPAQIDHAYRSAHVAALAGKAIVERYYGKPPNKSYFSGCSTGGRQAMMEAQRFPWDFDGIIAGSPSLHVTGIHMNLLWGNRALTDSSGNSALTQSNLQILHRAVVAACDMNDGLKDGLIGDPRACTFDPRRLLCKATQNAECLTRKQVEAIEKIYAGPRTSDGTRLSPLGGATKGSEITWLDVFRGPNDNPRATYNFVQEEFRYAAFQPSPGPAWTPEQFDFDRDYKRFGETDGLTDPVNPDLRRFKAAGGKLLSFAGWDDAAGMPLDAADYYETVERTMGGREATQQVFRLFVLPGMNHCGGGEGAAVVDWLSYLEKWVERGEAPDAVMSWRLKSELISLGQTRDTTSPETFPSDPGMVEFSRPVYPYPVRARYIGHGDPSRAVNFEPIP